VAGAASGIGAAVARRFAREGARLVLGDISPTVRDVAAELGEDDRRADVRTVVGDVTTEEFAEELIAQAAEAGGLDVLVVAAGVVQEQRTVSDLSREEWERVIGINATGSFLLCRAAAPALRRPGGRIVMLSSFIGHSGRAGYAAYSASKAALLALTHALAQELGPEGITVNAVAPGFVDTAMGRKGIENLAATTSSSIASARAARESTVPLGRLATAEEVAAVIRFLAGDDAGYITGACLDVNGGVLLR
jgi:NAD(P)-dependent dehydrogenase (short-subunit alcohol dehydrogenase family)